VAQDIKNTGKKVPCHMNMIKATASMQECEFLLYIDRFMAGFEK